MKYLEYREKRKHGTFDFPIAFYHIEPTHPRYMMTYHWHTEFEIIRILSGDFKLNIEGKSYNGRQGDVFFVRGGALHGGTPVDCRYECIVFDLRILMQDNHICTKQMMGILEHTIEVNVVLNRSWQNYDLNHVVEQLFSSMANRPLGYEFITQGALYQLFGMIVSEHLYKEVSVKNASDRQLLSFKNVLNYIEEHFSDQISLTDLASEAGMSEKYLCRFFKEMTGRTPIDYVNYYRIESACEMLSTKECSIGDAALSCGYNDLSYFSNNFKKYKGISPRAYITNKF